MFTLDKVQKDILALWAADQDEIARQKQLVSDDPLIRGMAESAAYYGACGGALTYCFTPTSIGTIIVVKHGQAEIDLTNYDAW